MVEQGRDGDGGTRLATALREAVGAAPDHDPAFAPAPGTEVLAVPSADGRRVSAVYVARDPYPPTDFFSAKGRDDGRLLRHPAKPPSGTPSFGVDPESPERGIVEGTGCLYVPPAALVQRHAAGAAGTDDLRSACLDAMRRYAAWRKGETYGVVVERFRVGRDGEVEPLGHVASWPCADLAGAEALRDRAADEARPEYQAPCP